MTRRAWFLILPAAGGCGRPVERPPLPETAPGGWRLREKKQQQAKTLATYTGPATVRVEVEDTGSPAAALDRAQRMRPEPNMVFFYKGNYFVTVRWEQVDRDALKTLVRELEKQ